MAASDKAEEAKPKAQSQALAERRAKARAARAAPAAGLITHARADRAYVVIFTKDHHPRELEQWRAERRARGYEPVNGPEAKEVRPEFVAGQPSAEIWDAPKEIADDEWRDALLVCLKNPTWIGEEVRSANRSIRQDVLNLAFNWHRSGRTDRALWDQLEALVFNTPVVQLGSTPHR